MAETQVVYRDERYTLGQQDGITYLILNDIHGDDAYKDVVTIKAGDFLNGYDVSAWAGQKLVVDEKHIAYGSGDDYDDLD